MIRRKRWEERINLPGMEGVDITWIRPEEVADFQLNSELYVGK